MNIIDDMLDWAADKVQTFTGEDSVTTALKELVAKNNGLWSAEAETYFLEHCPNI